MKRYSIEIEVGTRIVRMAANVDGKLKRWLIYRTMTEKYTQLKEGKKKILFDSMTNFADFRVFFGIQTAHVLFFLFHTHLQ